MKLFSIILLLLTAVACLDDNRSPEAALTEFIELRMGTVVTRDAILEKVTGKLQQSLENISDEEFQKFADLRNVSRESFKIVSKSCQEEKCFITYSLTYRTREGDETKFTSEVKKIAEVHNQQGKWLISDVSNIKTYHEAMVPIEAMGDQDQ